jgi:hypothetical protein
MYTTGSPGDTGAAWKTVYEIVEKIDEAIEPGDQSEERLYSPELLRIRGVAVLRAGSDTAASEAE